jgi:hypothetical protein
MVKFKAIGERDIIGLGLSEENIKRLKEGMPILVNKESLKIPFDIVILYGRTENEIEADIKKSLNIAGYVNDK